MLGHKNKGAYTDDFAYEPTTTRERTIAASVAIAWSLALAILAGLAHDTAPKLAGFIPAVEAVVLTATLFTAWMLFSQYRIKHHAPLAILACAFGLFGVLHGWYLAAFPGVFDTVGFAGTNSQSAVWLTEFARLGFAATVGVFVFVERSKRRSARWHAGIVARTSAAVLGYLLAAAFAVTAGSRWLPVLLLPSGTFSFFDTHVIAPFMLVAMFAAAAGIVVICGVQRRVHLWLSVVLLSMGLEVLASTLFGGKRFSFGWYVGHIDSALSSLLFFCVMQGQLAAILRRAARNSERALALHDMVSLGADTSLDRNTVMLERAALDLNFEWACLAQIDRGLVTLESSLGDSPYPAGYRAPAGERWLKDAQKRRDLLIIEGDEDAPWVDETPAVFSGWTTFVSVPVFVDGMLYGLAGFANSAKRKAPLNDADKQFLMLVGNLAGVTIERVRQRQRLDMLAYSDALTGLPNRAALFEILQKEMQTSQRYERRFALHFLDLDGFKAINDTHGHAAGDEVLREVAHRLKGVVRESDTVARLGGDEFVVLQPQVEDPKAPDRMAARLKAALGEPIPYLTDTFTIGASIGTSRFPQDGSEIHALLDRADEALYRMKARRRGPQEPRKLAVVKPRN